MMFWIGLILALAGGLLGIGVARELAKRRYPWIKDLHLDRIAVIVLMSGLVLSAVDHIEQAVATDRLEAEQRGRVLSNDNKSALIVELRRLPKLSITLSGIQGDRESIRFANILKDVFKSVGWSVDGVWEDIFLGGPGDGISVRQSEPLTNSMAQQIAEAFNKINVQARSVQMTNTKGGRIEVVVGSRP